jgi:hypothetical protein
MAAAYFRKMHLLIQTTNTKTTIIVMKQFSLLLLACCTLLGFARAATVSGTVTNAATSSPMGSHKVYINDSLGLYVDSTLTNSSGVYSFTLPTSITTGNYLLVYTRACGAVPTHYYAYTGSNITSNFSVCASSTPYQLHGTVSLGSTANNGLAKVYLIHQQFDSSIMAITLTAIDSTTTGSSGGGYSFSYSSIPYQISYGSLLLKAMLLPSHPSYASFLPTYRTSSLNWSAATALTAANFAPATSTNINMIAGTNPGGPGFIGGSVLVGANKSTGVGDPLSSRLLLLTDNAGQGIAYTYSDASGQFQFPSLAYGTYKIFGDAWGKTNPALTVTISAANPTINNVVFEENDKTFKGSVGGLGLVPTALSGVSIYPNPVTDYVQVNGLNSIGGAKTIVLSDVTGAVITRQTVEQNGVFSISTAALPAGVYLMQLHTTEGSASYKIVK